MKFYRSTHLLMCLSLETNVYHKDWPYSDDITQIVNFPTWISVTLTVLFFWIYLFFLTLVFVLRWLSLHWEILIILLPQFPLTVQ